MKIIKYSKKKAATATTIVTRIIERTPTNTATTTTESAETATANTTPTETANGV